MDKDKDGYVTVEEYIGELCNKCIHKGIVVLCGRGI